jgi:hypothetical protein
MTHVFDVRSPGTWTFNAVPSTILKSTTLELRQGKDPIKYAEGPIVKPKHSAAYWARVTAGFDFSDADRVPPARYNRVLWKGLMGSKPYPKTALEQRHKVDNDD